MNPYLAGGHCNADMREKLICSFLTVFYLLNVVFLSLDLLGIYEQAYSFSSIGFEWRWRVLSFATAAVCFYYMSWCLWKNPFDRKITLMVGTTMLLGTGIDLSACCLKGAYRPFLSIAIVVCLMFFIYSLCLLIKALAVQKT